MPVSMNNVSQINNTQPIKQQPKTTDEKTKSFPTKTAVVVGTGLAALAAVGIYLATKGKGGKAVQQATHNTQEAVQNVAQNAQEATNTIKEMTVDAFKQAGNKFNKGKAVTNTGEAFTGNITHQTKDGKKIVMEYENGLLNKSKKYDGENILHDKEYYYDDNGVLKVLSHIHDNGVDKILYSSDGAKKMRFQDDVIEFYDKNGVIADKIQIPESHPGVNYVMSYNDLKYIESCGSNGQLAKTYSYTTPQGIEGTIFRNNDYIKGKNKVTSNLLLETPDNKSYVVTRNGKDVQIKRNGEKEAIAKDSDEYKNVLAQSNDFMKQFFVKYKTALGLERQYYEQIEVVKDQYWNKLLSLDFNKVCKSEYKN